MKKRIFRGVATALVTPMNRFGEIDERAFVALLKRQVEGGIKAVVPFGTTGEGALLDKKEKLRLLEICKNTVDIPVIANCGGIRTEEVASFSAEAKSRGADAVLIITPYYVKSNFSGLVEHFYAVADRASAPVIVYNVPKRTGVDLTLRAYKKLLRHPNIVAVKEAGGDTVKALSLHREVPSACVYAGDDLLFLPFLSCGAQGIISVASNVLPRAMASVYDKFVSGDVGALKEFSAVSGLTESLFAEVNPIPVKYALSRLGYIENALRKPLMPLSPAGRRAVDKELNALERRGITL